LRQQERNRAMKTIKLRCDDSDYRAIQQAILEREILMGLPRGGGPINRGSNHEGHVIAGICRGWLRLV